MYNLVLTIYVNLLLPFLIWPALRLLSLYVYCCGFGYLLFGLVHKQQQLNAS